MVPILTTTKNTSKTQRSDHKNLYIYNLQSSIHVQNGIKNIQKIILRNITCPARKSRSIQVLASCLQRFQFYLCRLQLLIQPTRSRVVNGGTGGENSNRDDSMVTSGQRLCNSTSPHGQRGSIKITQKLLKFREDKFLNKFLWAKNR